MSLVSINEYYYYYYLVLPGNFANYKVFVYSTDHEQTELRSLLSSTFYKACTMSKLCLRILKC